MTALLVLLIAVISGTQASPALMELARIELVGAKRFSSADVARLSGLTIGKPVTINDLNDAAQRLANTGLFEKVTYRYTLAGRRATVIYELQELPWTIPVSFDNFVWFTNDQLVEALRRDLPTFDGTLPKSQEMPDLVIRSLQKLLETRKIPGRVEFAPEANLGGTLLQYIFAVKDPAPKLCRVQVTGTSVIPEKDLADAVRTGSGSDYSGFSVGNVVKGTLTEMYRRRGHWRATFGKPAVALEEAASCPGVAVTLSVAEGAPYAFAGAQWSGNPTVSAEQLDSALAMTAGEVADVSKLDAGLRAVRREYGRHGHLAMRSSYEPRLNEEAKRVTFDIQVTEGPQFRDGHVRGHRAVAVRCRSDHKAVATATRRPVRRRVRTCLRDQGHSRVVALAPRGQAAATSVAGRWPEARRQCEDRCPVAERFAASC